MAVGAPGEDDGRGSVTMYTRSRTDGEWDAEFNAKAPVTSSKFGKSVAISGGGTVAVVGAPGGISSPYSQIGAAYVYTKQSGTWRYTTKLETTRAFGGAPSVRGNFGESVAISADGRTIAVGAPSHKTVHSGVDHYGAVMIWELKDGVWTSTQTIVPKGGDYGNKKFGFGSAVDLSSSGRVLAVGMPDKTASVAGLGTVVEGGVVVYRREATTGWTSYTSAEVSDTVGDASTYGNRQGKYFGTSVAVSDTGATLAVGAPGYGAKPNSGAVFVYTFTGNTWVFSAKDSRDSEGARGGQSVALDHSGAAVLVGAPGYGGGKGVAVYYTHANGVLTPVHFQAGKVVGGLGQSVAMDAVAEVMAAGVPSASAKNAANTTVPEVGQVSTFDRFTVPGAVTVRGMDGSVAGRLSVTWATPAGNWGLLNTYVAVLAPGGDKCVTIANGCTFLNVTQGRSYSVSVTATNAVGQGPGGVELGPYRMGDPALLNQSVPPAASPAPADPESGNSDGGAPDTGGGATGGGTDAGATTTVPAAAPGTPTAVTVVMGYRRAIVTWAAPADGGATQRYEVTATPGNRKCLTEGETSCRFARLRSNRKFSFTVVAVNQVGAGPASAATPKQLTQPKVSPTTTASAAAVARFAGLAVGKRSTVRLAVVDAASKLVCSASTAGVRGIRAGTCLVKVSVTTNGKKRTKRVLLTAVR